MAKRNETPVLQLLSPSPRARALQPGNSSSEKPEHCDESSPRLQQLEQSLHSSRTQHSRI